MENAPDPEAKILVLDAIKPEESANGQLTSPELESKLADYSLHANAKWQAFLEAEPGSLDETKYAKSIARINMLKTAREQQITGRDKTLWAERYTQSTAEIYGRPNTELAGSIAASQMAEFGSVDLDDDDSILRKNRVLELLGRSLPENIDQTESGIEIEPSRREAIRESFADLHKPIAEAMEQIEEGPYDSARVREIFNGIIAGYESQNAAWAEWEITNTPNKTNLSVISPRKEIDVPDGRTDIADKEKLAALAYHEIGVHAFRSVMGYETGDDKMATGLPDYVDFEEGLGVFAEYLFSGKIPQKNEDRYLDVALALGLDGAAPMKRNDLIQFAIDRQVLRERAAGNEPELEVITADAESHVNRIFRGGDGELHSKPSGELTQAVFVKDMVYLEGFLKVVKYFEEKIDSGENIDEIWADLLAGKFDPTDPSHVKYKNEVLAGNLSD